MEWFSSVEFYILAITGALLLVGAVFNPPASDRAYAYIYEGAVDSCAQALAETGKAMLTVEALPDGNVVFRNTGVMLPPGSSVNITVEVQGDKLLCVEKAIMPADSTAATSCEVVWEAKCLKRRRYHLRYECEYADTWCTLTFINDENFSVTRELKY